MKILGDAASSGRTRRTPPRPSHILEDPLREPAAEPTEAWLRGRVGELVTWKAWQAIDATETAAGTPHGRPRVKLVRLEDLLRAGSSS